jgi:hypothetical protein
MHTINNKYHSLSSYVLLISITHTNCFGLIEAETLSVALLNSLVFSTLNVYFNHPSNYSVGSYALTPMNLTTKTM